jgi:spore cortex biosynthesis protein YabQ
MILSISEQVIVFLWTTVCGIVIAFIYDLFRVFRKAVKTGGHVIFIQDILFWLIACFIMFISIYHSNDGELRGFLFLGAFLGVVLYALLFSKAVMGSSLFIINIMVKTVKFLVFVILYPFRFLLGLPAKRHRSRQAGESEDIQH